MCNIFSGILALDTWLSRKKADETWRFPYTNNEEAVIKLRSIIGDAPRKLKNGMGTILCHGESPKEELCLARR